MATQGPCAVVAMETAAVLHQLRWLPEAWSAATASIHLAVPPTDAHRHRRGIRLHRREVLACDRVLIDGVPCLSLTRTLVEIARMRLPELLVVQILDGALASRRVSQADLLACLGRFAGERNVAIARRRILRSRERVRSPQETALRFMLEDAGIQVDTGIQIHDWDGTVMAEGDLGIERLLIWGEYDGFEPHTDRSQFRTDRVGDRWLDRRGWHVMRFVDRDLARPNATVRDWQSAIADAPARIAGLTPGRSPEVARARQLLGLDAA